MLTLNFRSALTLLCLLVSKYALGSVTFGEGVQKTYVMGETYNITYTPVDDESTDFGYYKSSWPVNGTIIIGTTTKGWIEWEVPLDLLPDIDYMLMAGRGMLELGDNEVAGIGVTILESGATSTLRLSSTRASTQTSSSTTSTPSMTSFILYTTGTMVTAAGARPTSTPTTVAESGAEAPPKEGLSKGSKAGIGVGSVVGAALLGVGALFLAMHLRRKREEVPYEDLHHPELVEARH